VARAYGVTSLGRSGSKHAKPIRRCLILVITSQPRWHRVLTSTVGTIHSILSVDARRQHADLIAAPALRIGMAAGHLAGGT
jgi:hypothetical protein